MNINEVISAIDASRIDLASERSGKWITWNIKVSERTASKFLARIKKRGVPCFVRGGRFGVLAEALEA